MEEDLLQALLAQEHRVWRALVEGDPDADAALLDEDFLGVYPSGFAGRADHAGQLARGPSVAAYVLEAARVLEAGADHAMLCYRARYTRPGGAAEEAMYVSSLWRREGAGWINVFSQDTPADGRDLP